ncbi:MAG: dual specificity protein phosphatase family protein [Parachlamydiaceae bacterium]|nr:dual specificity protein phosphatase family protein [Parachlamydiaceae bacterium]
MALIPLSNDRGSNPIQFPIREPKQNKITEWTNRWIFNPFSFISLQCMNLMIVKVIHAKHPNKISPLFSKIFINGNLFGIIATIYFRRKQLLYHGSLIFSLFKTTLYPQSQVWWNTILEGKIILGAIPLKNKEHHDSISKKAHSILTLLEDFEIYSPGWFSVPVTHHDWAAKKITQKHIITEDFKAVPLNAIKEGVAFLREQILQDKAVYVHCKAGRGRSATIVVCYILKYWNEILPSDQACSVEKAIAFVKQQRPVINLNSRQRKAIEDYYFSDVLVKE